MQLLEKHAADMVSWQRFVAAAEITGGSSTLAWFSFTEWEQVAAAVLTTRCGSSKASPKQARGELERLGVRSDVYSLGATLYCILAGKPSFENGDVAAVPRAVEAGQFEAPANLEPSVNKALEAVCLKAMATKPEDRHSTARQPQCDPRGRRTFESNEL